MVAGHWRDLLHSGHGTGVLPAAPDVHTGEAQHPACGDEVACDLRLADGVIVALRWRAQACPATTAVLSFAALELPGVRAAAAIAHLQAAAKAKPGLAAHEQHALALVCTALRAAMRGSL